MKLSQRLTLVSAVFALSAVGHADPVSLDAEPVRVSMFKNGLAMVTSRAAVHEAGTYQVATPEARYGSLWLNWEDGLDLKQIVSTESKRTEEVSTLTVREMLKANVGKTFSIPGDERGEWVTVTLLSMPTDENVDQSGRYLDVSHQGYHGQGGYDGSPFGHPRIIAPTSNELMIIKTENGVEARHPNSVNRIRFNNPDDLQTTTDREMVESVLRFEADGDNGLLELNYLAQGIAWSPSYVVELLDDESVRVACKAVIVNDLMDLDNVDVELIAGYPNIQFASTPSAMSRVSLNQLLQSLMQSGQNRGHNVMSNRMVAQQAMSYSDGFSNISASLPTEPVAGEGAEDLYFYQIPDVTLAKGERGYFPLLSADVPACPHVYTWEIADYVDQQGRYHGQPDESQQVVWHSIELTNTTEQPWTTAPAMTVKDGRVLGQDTMHFVPPGGSTLLRITQAISVDAQQNELEVERERGAAIFHGSTYDKVTIEGKLKITNHKAEAVTVRISKTLTGEVVSADAAPDVVKLASGLRGVNPRSRLTWEIEVQPGAEEGSEVTYRYSFFTR